MMKKKISLVIPAYNEELMIPHLFKRLQSFMNLYKKCDFEVILIDDGSKDATLKKLITIHNKDKRFKIVELAKNGGCDNAIITGLQFASGHAAIIMMADLQEPPELIPSFIDKWEEGYDIVYGEVKKRINRSLHLKIGTYFFYKIMRYLTGNMLPENVSDFRLLDKTVYKTLASLPEHHKFFRGLAVWVGFKRYAIPFERPDRVAGYSKATVKATLTVALNGIFGFSTFPLRLPWLIVITGFILTLLSIIGSDRSQTLSYVFMTFLALIGAIQSEYLLRILSESRQRPNSIIRKTYGLS